MLTQMSSKMLKVEKRTPVFWELHKSLVKIALNLKGRNVRLVDSKSNLHKLLG